MAPGRPRRVIRPREEFGRAAVGVLAKARAEKGLSRAQLAQASEISPATIAKIEQGATTDPGFTVVVAIADALDLQLDNLVREARRAAVDRG